MNVSTFGSRFYGGQISRIDSGLEELGHIVNSNETPDLIYCNDFAHANEAFHVKLLNQKSKYILNILDVPHWIPEWNKIFIDWRAKLGLADKITCISKAVQKDIKDHFDIDAEVIYNPIKSVSWDTSDKDIFALFVGRALAPNKRVLEILKPLNYKLLQNLGESHHISIVGSENPRFGSYYNVVSDEILADLYQRSLFILIPSKQEGLNLPLIEGICSSCVPIVCEDMSTAHEFITPEFMCKPTADDMYNKITSMMNGNNNDIYSTLKVYSDKYLIQFSPKQIAQNILNVYQTLV